MRRRILTQLHQETHGQTLVVAMLILTVVLVSAAAAIEGGNMLLQRRNLQGNADASALAAAAYLPTNVSLAESTARTYATNMNAADGASIDRVSFSANNSQVKVTVRRRVDGSLLGVLGISPPIVRATATAEVAKFAPTASQGMLPMAFLRDSYELGTNVEVKFDGTAGGCSASSSDDDESCGEDEEHASSNHGPVALTSAPPSCSESSGGSDFEHMIAGSEHGGVDSCAVAIGDTINTEPGNMSGPTRQGLEDRIGSNTDSFDDLFTYDAHSSCWSAKNINSPRVGIVPVVENSDGTSTWGNGRHNVRVVGYVTVYIGKTEGDSEHHAYTNNGKSVWVTPVKTLLPKDFSDLTPWYEGTGDEPVAIHLIT